MHHIIIHQYDPDRHVAGGIDGFIRDLIKHADPEHNFSLIGVTGTDSTRILGRWQQLDVGGSNPISFMPVARIASGEQGRRLPHTIQLVAGIHRFHPRIRCDVAHFHRVETASMCARFTRGAKRIVFVHGPGTEALKHGVETYWRFAPAVYDRFERHAIRGAQIAYIMHGDKAERMRQRFPNVRHGQNWYDGSVFHPAQDEPRTRRPVVAWVGRFEEPKDPLLAVQVFSELAAREVAFDAWMAGGGTLRHLVESQISSQGLGMVKVTGVLGANELARLLQGTDVFLGTSLWEGIPRAVIEALACGVPVVSTDVGDVRHLVADDAGIVVEQRSASLLTSAVERVLADDRRGPHVAVSVEHLNVSRVVPQLLEELQG